MLQNTTFHRPPGKTYVGTFWFPRECQNLLDFLWGHIALLYKVTSELLVARLLINSLHEIMMGNWKRTDFPISWIFISFKLFGFVWFWQVKLQVFLTFCRTFSVKINGRRSQFSLFKELNLNRWGVQKIIIWLRFTLQQILHTSSNLYIRYYTLDVLQSVAMVNQNLPKSKFLE